MATDQQLLKRMQTIMAAEEVVWTEKKMFGGNCFMVDEKMCFGTYKGGLMVRIAPEEVQDLLKRPFAEIMMHGGRPMKGYLFIQPEGYEHNKDLEFWIKKCLEFNPRAKSSKRK